LTFSGNVQTGKLSRFLAFFTQSWETQNTFHRPNKCHSSSKFTNMSNGKGELIHSDLVKAQTEAQQHHFWHQKCVENSTTVSLLGIGRMAKSEVLKCLETTLIF
jgi:hypothetical protein